VIDCQTPSGQIPGDELQQGIDGYGGKDVEKGKVLRQEWKTPWEVSTTGPGLPEPGDWEIPIKSRSAAHLPVKRPLPNWWVIVRCCVVITCTGNLENAYPSVSSSVLIKKKLPRSGRPRYRRATTIQGPRGRSSTRNWRRHHLDHPAICQLATLRLSSVRKWTRPVLLRPLSPHQCSTYARRRVVCHCSSQWRPMKCVAYSERFPAKHCSLDPAPTWLVKKLAEDIIPVIRHVCNTSFEWTVVCLMIRNLQSSDPDWKSRHCI